MATEIEMKLSVPDQETLERVLADPELLQYAKDDYAIRRMKSIYYDTPDNQLHQRKWTLRLRDEDNFRVAAFKTANMSNDAGFFTRNEWQCAVDNIEDAIPMLIDQGAPRELKSLLKGKELSARVSETLGFIPSAAFAALAALRQQLEAQAKATLGAQMEIQIPINLTYNYNVTNPTPPKPTITAQTVTAIANAGGRANGGFTNGPELSWVGEDGPEAIIPLGAKRRERGLELYKQVGEILGAAKNAEGGIHGGNIHMGLSFGGPAYQNTTYTGATIGNDSYQNNRYGSPISIYSDSAYQNDNFYANQLTNAPASHITQEGSNRAETEYKLQNNRMAVYHSTSSPIFSLAKIRSGDTYGGAELYSSPAMASIYNMREQNALTSASYAPHTFVYGFRPGTRSMESISPLPQIEAAHNLQDSRTTAYHSAQNSVSDYTRNLLNNPVNTAYDIQNNQDTGYSVQHNLSNYAGNALNNPPGTAYDFRDNRITDYYSSQNNVSNYAGNILDNPAMTYQNTYAAGDIFSEAVQAGQGSLYGGIPTLLSPERVTSFDAQESARAASGAGAGVYPESTLESDSGAVRANPDLLPAINDPDRDVEQDNGFSERSNNQFSITIHVNVNPHFNIDGSGGQSMGELEAMVHRCVKEMSDEIGGDIAEHLIPVFQNMPM